MRRAQDRPGQWRGKKRAAATWRGGSESERRWRLLAGRDDPLVARIFGVGQSLVAKAGVTSERSLTRPFVKCTTSVPAAVALLDGEARVEPGAIGELGGRLAELGGDLNLEGADFDVGAGVFSPAQSRGPRAIGGAIGGFGGGGDGRKNEQRGDEGGGAEDGGEDGFHGGYFFGF